MELHLNAGIKLGQGFLLKNQVIEQPELDRAFQKHYKILVNVKHKEKV